jgi:hypothetical protein
LQFGTATALESGRFRLERLVRARAGSEWATGSHAAGEIFCLLDRDTLAVVDVPLSARGGILQIRDSSGSTAQASFGAEWVRPLSPCRVTASFETQSGLTISWTRRSRAGFAWLDEIDAPLGESSELYRVTLVGGGGEAEMTTGDVELVVPVNDLVPLGSGPVRIEVSQIGDCGASRPASRTLEI